MQLNCILGWFHGLSPTPVTPVLEGDNPIDALLSAHGLRRTAAARRVLGWLLAHPETSYTHAQLQESLAGDHAEPLDRVTLYRLIDRLTQVGLLLCRVDSQRVRRYQAMPASVHATPTSSARPATATARWLVPCMQWTWKRRRKPPSNPCAPWATPTCTSTLPCAASVPIARLAQCLPAWQRQVRRHDPDTGVELPLPWWR